MVQLGVYNQTLYIAKPISPARLGLMRPAGPPPPIPRSRPPVDSDVYAAATGCVSPSRDYSPAPRLGPYRKIKAPTRWHCVTLQVQAFVQS